MLSVGKLAAGGEAYYLDTVARGAEEYYTGAGEAPGEWLGAGSDALGFAGVVEPELLSRVLAGESPDGMRLASSSRRVPGFDLTFSAPKSVSVLWALEPTAAGELVAAHDTAVRAALGWLEREACFGAQGAEVVPAGGFLAAGFRHRTSRAGDPQLHTHVVVANLGQGPDGRWTALDARHVFRQARTAGYLYQAQLRHELTRRLGVAWGEVEHGAADLAAVDPHLLLSLIHI